MATKEELAEVRTKQALLEQAIAQIADSMREFADTSRRFVSLAERFEAHLERSEAIYSAVAEHDKQLAIIDSHDVVKKVEQHDRDMPGLKEVRSWIINGVVAIVGSVFLAAAAVIFS